ncbi:MAG: prenyltransferase/squalene oxidase repeat-containing protein [Planctomycetota bacterium]
MNQLKTASGLEAAYHSVRQNLLQERIDAGHWVGELSASALSTATAISTLSFLLDQSQDDRDIPVDQVRRQIDAGFRWLLTQQNDDGGWGDTPKSHSNISTSMLVVAAIHAAKRDRELNSQVAKAESYIESQGGIPGLKKRYGIDKTFAVPILANCAMAGIVDWKQVSALPFEAACVPQRFYNLLQLPVVSYAIPALVAIGQVKFHKDPPWDPIRKIIRQSSVAPSLRVLEKMMPQSGGFLEAVPLTSFVSMALIHCGKQSHPVVKKGIQFILDSFRVEDDGGSWPIDTNLATWTTTLSINSLAVHSSSWINELQNSDETDHWRNCFDWLMSCQNLEIHPFTGAAPGGWGWTDLSGAVPDADDTPGALLALRQFFDHAELLWHGTELDQKKKQILKSKELGIQWLLGLQNRDRGWPTFCRGWGKLPFDRSGTDITAHAIRGLLAWKDRTNNPTLGSAIDKGFRFLSKTQRKDGSWIPLWFGNQDLPDEINPYYGTAKVLSGYWAAGGFDTTEARIGLKWVRDNQNPDGGWGGGESLAWPDSDLGRSSVEETALCTEVLLNDADEQSKASAQRGVQWLIRAVESNQIQRSWPIGFYFARLWYFEKMYPLVFATSALGRALAQQQTE